MFVKVILVATFLKICSANGPSNHQPHSNHAVSTINFVRHDVPLSYKYSAVHIYSTPKPNQYKHDEYRQDQPSKTIQYAPVYSHQEVNAQHQAAFLKTSDHKTTEAEFTPEKQEDVPITKTNLEPKPQLQNLDYGSNHLPYFPGYNVEILQAVNRIPGHNAVYRSYPNMAPNDKINKVNYLNQYVLHQKPEEEYVTLSQTVKDTIPTEVVDHTQATLAPFVPKQHHHHHQHQHHISSINAVEQKPNLNNAAYTVKATSSPQAFVNLQDLIFHPKAHRMLLNIARNYNIARNPLKAQHASITLLKNIPSHTQEIIKLPSPVDFEKNTRLLPIQNNKLHLHSHRLS